VALRQKEGRGKGKQKDFGGERGEGIMALDWSQRMEGGSGEGGQARRGSCRRRLEQGKEAGGRGIEGEYDRWGRPVGGCEEKEKAGGEAGRYGRRLGGPWAGWARREVRFLFLFFFFLFKLFSKSNLFNSNSNQNFSNLSQYFINLLDLTQATKNHA
jgi:hypothetical protein